MQLNKKFPNCSISLERHKESGMLILFVVERHTGRIALHKETPTENQMNELLSDYCNKNNKCT